MTFNCHDLQVVDLIMIRKWALAKIALVGSIVYGMFVSAKADFIFYSYPRPKGRGN